MGGIVPYRCTSCHQDLTMSPIDRLVVIKGVHRRWCARCLPEDEFGDRVKDYVAVHNEYPAMPFDRRSFGVEIEFHGSQRQVRDVLRHANVTANIGWPELNYGTPSQ